MTIFGLHCLWRWISIPQVERAELIFIKDNKLPDPPTTIKYLESMFDIVSEKGRLA
jgi:hypothetical protein